MERIMFMTRIIDKPIIVISKCLGFESCRYNGGIQNDDFIKKLYDFVEYITVCPEIEIGLSTPREPIRIVQNNGELSLVQPKTGKDLSKAMYEFSQEFMNSLENVDGFVLKSRSPSCGIKDVKIYPKSERGGSSTKGKGFFAAVAQEKLPYLAIEDEGRLKDFKISIAIGMASTESDNYHSLYDVHKKSDEIMYANKKIMKVIKKDISLHKGL